MLKGLAIENFKAWRDTGPIRMAPITLFFGANSSGKTSLHQLLLLLQQTAQSSDRRRVLHLGDGSSTVDLGVFNDVLFEHESDSALHFSLLWESPYPFEIQDPRSDRHLETDTLVFDATIRLDDQGRIRVDSMKHCAMDGNDHIMMGMRLKPESDEYELIHSGYDPIRALGRKWPLPAPTRFYGFPYEAIDYYQNTAFLADFNLQLEWFLSSIFYVGPLREYPKRLYLWSGEEPDHVGKTGNRAIEALLAGQDRRINRGSGTHYQDLQIIVARWLKQMGLISEFEVRPIAQNRKEYEVLVQTADTRSQVKLTDVGFGISQVLPVIVECFYVKPDSIVIFEQPEIHLHPRVQADLADLFIEAIHAREDGRDRNLQLIIESHSEHFLRRLQRRIAEGKISSEQVAIYFCEAGLHGSTINRLEITPYGRITNWPTDFFGDIMGDTAAQVRSALMRRKEEAKDEDD
ncbi:MAG: DUF3696 domain-containing protein [Deltaproteobacteria bacterium]|nr:DUF3696 domain-containing protein [Deltaproteobacteria bacterium]